MARYFCWILYFTGCGQALLAPGPTSQQLEPVDVSPTAAGPQSNPPTAAPTRAPCVPGAQIELPSAATGDVFLGCGRVRADVTEVTVDQYADCVASGACSRIAESEGCRRGAENPRTREYPQVCVDRQMASAFCEWNGGRLPTSSEWIYLATGGQQQSFPWGDEAPTPERTSMGMFDSAPVCSFVDGASPLGLYGMSGNAWEWVEDPGIRDLGRHCGGSFESPDVRLLEARCESEANPDSWGPSVGFRCVYCDSEVVNGPS